MRHGVQESAGAIRAQIPTRGVPLLRFFRCSPRSPATHAIERRFLSQDLGAAAGHPRSQCLCEPRGLAQVITKSTSRAGECGAPILSGRAASCASTSESTLATTRQRAAALDVESQVSLSLRTQVDSSLRQAESMRSGIRYDDQKMSRLMDVLGAAPCQKMDGFTLQPTLMMAP